MRVVDDKTLMIPDRRGNNRIDSLRNIVRDPRVSLLFLIPGVGETLRVIGRATISTDPALCESFVFNGKPPRCVLVVAVEQRLLPVLEGDRALEAVGRGDAGRPQEPADHRHDLAEFSGGKLGGEEYDRDRAGADQGDDLLMAAQAR